MIRKLVSRSSKSGDFEQRGLDQAILQIGGGLLSSYGGDKIDGVNTSGAVQNIYKEATKFMIETGSNAAPSLVPDEK